MTLVVLALAAAIPSGLLATVWPLGGGLLWLVLMTVFITSYVMRRSGLRRYR